MSNNFYSYMYETNKSIQSSAEKVVEDKDNSNTTKFYTIHCRDYDKTLLDLINYIAKNGNGGHSFDIIVDPGDKREKAFFWDGDGSDYIKAVISSKSGEDKELVGILLSALGRIAGETYASEYNPDDDAQKHKITIENIRNIVSPLLDGAGFEDTMKEALREVRFILNNHDSTEKKLDSIKFIVEEALK